MSGEEKRELAVKEPELIAPASVERTLEALKRFQEFKTRALSKNDYVVIQGKRTVKKSGWLKYALACSLSLELREEREDRREGEVIYHYAYRAIAPNGRYADAVGSASSKERQYAHEVHDVRALAQTRAMERAISNLVGGGELGAEELTGPEPSEPPPTPAAPKPSIWEVPVTKAVQGPEARVRQFPLVSGTKALGMLNVLKEGYEASLVPEKPIPAEDPAVSRFLIAKVIAGMAEAHPGLAYEVARAEDGSLAAIMIRGPIEEPLIKELQGAAAWAFGKALERVEKG